MTAYVAFLRRINVGGKNKVGMAELKQLAAETGFENPRTLLQSGNLVFDNDAIGSLELERLFEDAIAKKFGLNVDCQVRSAEDLTGIVSKNPFPKQAEDDPSHLVVAFFRNPLEEQRCLALMESNRGREIMHALGREAYIYYPDGIGESKLTNALMDSKLAQRGTARNWNTVQKLHVAASNWAGAPHNN